MIFEKGHLYHIFNQGNNRWKIFYNRENYIYFLKKIDRYILPYADVLAWCLMPNHFHLMVIVNETQVFTQGFTPSETLSKSRSLNDSIGILLRTYTRAINKQNGDSGSLFRKETKAECIDCFKVVKSGFMQSNMMINNCLEEKQYPQVCFNYIHQNPVKAKLVRNAMDWEFSSAKDYAGLRNGNLINRLVASEYVDIGNSGLLHSGSHSK